MPDFGNTTTPTANSSNLGSIGQNTDEFTTSGQQLDSVSIYVETVSASTIRIGLYYSASASSDPADYTTLVEDLGTVVTGMSPAWVTATSSTNPSLSTGYYFIVAERASGGTMKGFWDNTAGLGDLADSFHYNGLTDDDASTALPGTLSTGTELTGSSLGAYFTYSAASGGGLSIPVAMNHYSRLRSA